jgi:hypothetical protein
MTYPFRVLSSSAFCLRVTYRTLPNLLHAIGSAAVLLSLGCIERESQTAIGQCLCARDLGGRMSSVRSKRAPLSAFAESDASIIGYAEICNCLERIR